MLDHVGIRHIMIRSTGHEHLSAFLATAGEAAMTDLGFTGGGKESGKMYVSGRPDHNVSNADMVEHIVELVEKKAERLKAQREAAEAVAAE